MRNADQTRDPKQVQWIQSYYQIFKDLAEYVKNTFPQGIPWNPKGISAAEAAKATTSAAPAPAAPAPAPAAGGPPPPPPPPPGPPPRFEIPETVPSAPGGIGAVFSELNKGEAVTKGLKKVNPNEMTHKNPSLRAGSTVPTRSDSQTSVSSVNRGKSPVPSKKPKPETLRTKKPPKKELDGNKWLIVRKRTLVIKEMLIFYRRTMTMSPRSSRSKLPSHTQFSSADAARQLSEFTARQMRFPLTTLHDFLLSSTL
jgi:adenylyl cyclase-associated protein